MGSPRRETQGAVHFFRRCSGIPLLSCAVVFLLAAPALAVTGTVPRVASPRPVASPEADGPGMSGDDRLPEGLSAVPGNGSRSVSPRAPGVMLPLPVPVGHHEHSHEHSHEHDAEHRPRYDHRPGERAVEAGSRESWNRAQGAVPADRARVGPGHGAASPAGDAGATADDAAPGPAPSGRPGSERNDPTRSTPTGPAATPSPPSPRKEPTTGSDGSTGREGLWSPAPVAPEDAGGGAAEPGPPQAGPPDRQPSSGQDAPGQGAPGQGAPGQDAPSENAASETSVEPLLPVLPLGAGLTSLGLGLAFLALRMRRG